MRNSPLTAWCAAGLLGAAGVAFASGDDFPVTADFAQRAPTGPTSRAVGEQVDVAALRLREGTRLRDVAGRFRQNGESLTFIDAQNREISGLPNLNLERVARMLRNVEEPESITWSVSGTITEFGSRNYLLISRAVYKSAAPPPAPEIFAQPPAIQGSAPAGAPPAPARSLSPPAPGA